ncbi:hypothetical protein [Niabella hibiscisoli]|uniref:hypothetical protein n=1 Tax=Niabella hibiscisoli TaxID=1825928 RepID=UPI001F117144|nr:hypothetical protein [Niabella hibiscisoli]MCH5715739.1 hypothetical protein [Niabella hibiscisoli]
MIIQLHADRSLSIHEEYALKLNGVIARELDRFAELLTRVELHLADENAQRKTKEDKKCTIEAKLKSKHPVTVTSHGNTYDNAVTGAVQKLKASLDTIVGKMQHH